MNTTKGTPEPCTICGKPVVMAGPALAAGLAHPRCRYSRSLTASATDADYDALALRVWRFRRVVEKLNRILATEARNG